MPSPQTAPVDKSAKVTRPAPTHNHEGIPYLFGCQACRQEDLERSRINNPTIPQEMLEFTTFLVPIEDYEEQVCREYLRLKYPDAPWIGSTFDVSNLMGLAADEREQLVIIRRAGLNGKGPGPGSKPVYNSENIWVRNDPVPVETYLNEVVESRPINIRASLEVVKPSRFVKSHLDKQRFVEQASSAAYPAMLQMPRHKDDVLMTLRARS